MIPAARSGVWPVSNDRVSQQPVPAECGEPEPSLPAPRVDPGGRRELGWFGWMFCRFAARVWKVPEIHLFTVLARHRRLFWTWAPFAGVLLRRGRLAPRDTELVILRVGHRRDCEYELQQHRRIALDRGVDERTQAAIFAWPEAAGLSERHQVMLTAVDQLLADRTLSAANWQALAGHLEPRQLIEFVTLVGQYDALAMTLNTLEVPMDYPY